MHRVVRRWGGRHILLARLPSPVASRPYSSTRLEQGLLQNVSPRTLICMEYVQLECSKHGLKPHAKRTGRKNSFRCLKCTSEHVSKHRKSKKALLVKEAGGKCVACGYNKYIGALEFHHRDPKTKSFGISSKGQTYSLVRMRAEIAKCDLLCANCHAERENGLLA